MIAAFEALRSEFRSAGAEGISLALVGFAILFFIAEKNRINENKNKLVKYEILCFLLIANPFGYVGKRQVLHLFPCVVADEHFGCGTQGGRQPAGSEENDHERCRGQPDAVGFGVVALRPSLIDCVGVDARHQAREGIPCAVTLVNPMCPKG